MLSLLSGSRRRRSVCYWLVILLVVSQQQSGLVNGYHHYGETQHRLSGNCLLQEARNASRLVLQTRGGSGSREDEVEGIFSNTTAPASTLTTDDDEEVTSSLSSSTTTGNNYTFSLFQEGDGSENGGIPDRYLRMAKGNRQKAKAFLEATLAWRAQNDVDSILSRPNPRLYLYKHLVPHGFLGRDPSDHVIFCMRAGYVNFDLMEQHDIVLEDFVMHYVYILEYLWNILEPGPSGTMVFLVDLSGVSLGKLRRFVGFVKQFCSTIDQHYPQRGHKTLVVNAPKWFGTMYRVISPLLRESTRQMIELYSQGNRQTEALRKYLGPENIPQEMISNSPPSSLIHSSLQGDFEEFSRARTESAGAKMIQLSTI